MSPQKQYSEEELIQVAKPSPETEPLFRGFVRALLPFLNGAPQAGGALPGAGAGASERPAPLSEPAPEQPPANVAGIIALVLGQIRRDPVLLKLALEKPVIEVSVNKTIVQMDDSGLKGKIATLIHERWFQQPRSFAEIRKELVRRGVDGRTGNVIFGNALKSFVEMGFFFLNGDGYELAPGAESRVIQN